jgi:hypothetical protein
MKTWPLLLLTGLLIGLMGYVIAATDPLLFDIKEGYCQGKCFVYTQSIEKATYIPLLEKKNYIQIL